jgi:hypothetical protein
MDLHRLHVREALVMGKASLVAWDAILFELAGSSTRLVLGEPFFTCGAAFSDTCCILRDRAFVFERVTAHIGGLSESDRLGALTAIHLRCPTVVICHRCPVEDHLIVTQDDRNSFFVTCPKCRT